MDNTYEHFANNLDNVKKQDNKPCSAQDISPNAETIGQDNKNQNAFAQLPIKYASSIDFNKTPKVKFFVEDLISEGVTFLTAFPKVGKSRMIMQMSLAICSGTPFLGKVTTKTGVLYCALEDDRMDFENRLKQFLDGNPVPKNFLYCTKEDFSYSAPTLGEDENAKLIPFLEQVLKDNPSVKVIAIDVFGVIRSKRQKGMDFTMHERADINQLLKLAAKYRISVIVTHHVAKSSLNIDRPSAIGSGAGSYVIAGSIHAELELALDHNDKKRAKFSFSGRRIPTGEMALRNEYPYWTAEGDWNEVKFSQDPVVIMIQRLVKQYGGSWKGSSKEFYDENLKSGMPLLVRKPNKNTFLKISSQLRQLGIQYIVHPNGSGSPKHEFRRLSDGQDDEQDFIEIASEISWEDLTT